MRTPRPVVLVVLLALSLVLPRAARAQLDEVINLGDTFSGQIAFDGDQDLLAFTGVEGQLVTITAKSVGKASGPVVATLFDFDTQSSIDTTAFESGFGGKSFKIVKFPLPFTGAYLLAIDGATEGSTGSYTITTKAAVPGSLKKVKNAVIAAPGGVDAFGFDAPEGALLSAVVRPSKGSGALPVVGELQTPDGPVDVSAFTTVKGSKTTVKKVPAPSLGEYALEVGNLGDAGGILVDVTVKFPKVKKRKLVEPSLPGALSGQVVVQDIPVVPEIEPNDQIAETQFVGALGVGSVLRVVGDETAQGDIDNFRVTVAQDMTLDLVLLHDVQAADFDLEVYPAGGIEPIAVFATFPCDDQGCSPELGSIAFTGVPPGGFDVDVVVVHFSGSSGYMLSMTGGGNFGGQSAAFAADAGDPAAFRAPPAVQAALAQRPGLAAANDRRLGLDKRFVGEELVVRLADAARDPYAWAAEHGYDVRVASPSGAFVAGLPLLAGGGDEEWLRRETVRERERVRRLPGVASVEVNFLNEAYATSATPNDPLLSFQWHYPQIRLPEAWQITQGSADVIVAVIDTGITPHPDLVDRDTGTGFDMISNPQIALDGNGIDPDPTDPGDQNVQGKSSWHGTHVAGTVGASTNNGIGVAGVDQACGIMALRVLGKGGGTNFDIAEAIRYAARLPNASNTLPPKKANVINMSLGGGGFDANMNQAIQAARAAGVTIVAAAGNENTSQESFPAAYDGVIAVGATDFQKQRAFYSNFGPWVDIAAPGGDTSADLNGDNFADGVLSTVVDDSSQPFQFAFKFENGTSMASPHIAGICALLLAVDPTLTPDEIEAILENTASTIATDQPIGKLVDVLAAVQLAQQGVGGGGDVPLLAVSTNALAFGPAATQLQVVVTNVGGGDLGASASNAEDDPGDGDWLKTSALAPAGGPLTVTVDRTGLPNGSYTGKVFVTSAGGNATITVSMTVTATGGTQFVLDVGDVIVLAVDLDTLSTVGGDVADGASGAWFIDAIPAGAYLVAAGPDLDNDGFICGIGEPCGLFPVLNDPVLVQVPDGVEVTGVDFAVVDAVTLASAVGAASPIPAGGFARPAQD